MQQIEINKYDMLIPALIMAQKEFTMPKRVTQAYNYKYAPLDVVIESTKNALAKNGLTVVQAPISRNGEIGVTTVLFHESGQNISCEYTVSPQKKDPQSLGSLITYFRRYAYMAVLGLAPEDDDGKAAMPEDKTMVARKVYALANKLENNELLDFLADCDIDDLSKLIELDFETLTEKLIELQE